MYCGCVVHVVLCDPCLYQCCVHILKFYSPILFSIILNFDIHIYEHISQLSTIFNKYYIIAGALDDADLRVLLDFNDGTKVKREECKTEERRRRGAEEGTKEYQASHPVGL